VGLEFSGCGAREIRRQHSGNDSQKVCHYRCAERVKFGLGWPVMVGMSKGEMDERCQSCGALYEYTAGCKECDESREALYALTGDPRYKFPRHFRNFEESER
jgi:hypothetical protein